MTSTDSDNFDYVIVGGGSAGCVIASRLSADSRLRVALIEAGPDFQPGAEPSALSDPGARAFMLPQYFWPDLIGRAAERRIPVLQARVIGGGSSINGMHAQRGTPADYEDWRQHGVTGWSWVDNLPYFKKLENDLDFGGPLHGKEGPVAIRRVPESQWSRLTLALRKALDSRGLAHLDDLNAQDGDGTGAVPLNIDGKARMSAAAAYLTPAVRTRSNLRILANTQVLRLKLAGRKVAGVELAGGRTVAAANVLVCAGAIHSPALLLRSGFGPGSQLQASGITVVADRPGIGQNLRNHPFLSVTAHLKRQARQNDRSVRPPVTMVTRYSSGVGAESTDMLLNLWERTPGPLLIDPLGRQLAQLMLLLNKSHSQGEVRLNPADPAGAPQIDANILSASADLQRMVQGFRLVCELLTGPAVGGLLNNRFVDNMSLGLPPDELTLKLLQDNSRARWLSTLGACLADWIPGMRQRMMSKAGRPVGSILEDPDGLADFVRSITSVGGHPAGTCRLGSPSDEHAVVDSRCRVIGAEGLRVVDASIFPTLMRAGTNVPVIMAAEKVADMVLEDRRPQVSPRVVTTTT